MPDANSPIAINSVNDAVNTNPTTATPLETTPLSLEAGIVEMTGFAIRRGIALPAEPVNGDRVTYYNTLVETIKPATVQSIRFIDGQVTQGVNGRVLWYRMPIFTKCIVIAAIALFALIGISLLPSVNEANLEKGLLASSGMVLLANLVFICSASLLGVMFYLLKTITDKIKDYSLLPIDGIEINTTILIGLISGFIIAELFTFTTSPVNSSIELHKMTLALLGGFSSDAIFTVLQGIVNKAKSFLTTS